MAYGDGHEMSSHGEGKRYRSPNKVRVKQDWLTGHYNVEHKHPEYPTGDGYTHYSSHGTKDEAKAAKTKLQDWFKKNPKPQDD